MSDAFIVRRCGGGGSGGTLTVSSIDAGTVCVSNAELGKSYTKPIVANGKAVFRGLASGVWTVNLEGKSSATAQQITIVSDYSLSVSFFAAVINISYPVGSTCTAECDGLKYDAPDTSGSWELILPFAGTWRVYCSIINADGSLSSTNADVVVNSDGQEVNLTLLYDYILYDAGWENEEKTGGWITQHETSSGYDDTITRNADTLKIAYVGNNTFYLKGTGYFGPANELDLEPYKALVLEVTNVEALAAGSAAAPVLELRDSLTSTTVLASVELASGTVYLDISSFTNSLYVSIKIIALGNMNAAIYNGSAVTISHARLSKLSVEQLKAGVA